MTFSKIGRILTALVATAALGLGMTACGGGTIGFLYVAGTFYNQVSGFKIDDYTGNLTAIDHQPFAAGGNNPVTVLVKSSGRYVYVINSGTAVSAGSSGIPGTANFNPPGDSGIAVFSVGGDGVLTYQETYQSKGYQPVWATFDTSGNYLYVLDKYSEYYCAAAPCKNPNPANTSPIDTNASLTAFSVASDTGRLSFIANAAVLSLTTHVGIDVFEVGQNPIMSKVGSGNCLYTLSPTSIYPYVVTSGSGQLVTTTTGPFAINGATNLTSINTTGTYTYLTDQGTNQIFAESNTGNCSLTGIAGSQMANVPGAINPVNSLTVSNGKFLYVVNQTNFGTQQTAQSTISAFTIDQATGRLSVLADSTNNPYAVGSGPVCIVQDPTGQYIYTSNNADSTLTGKLLNQQYGTLSNLSRGSVFATTMRPTCLAVDGNV